MYPSTSCGEIFEDGFSVQEKKSARSLMVCFLALECGYWQVSQFENWVSSVCMVPPEDDFSGEYHIGRQNWSINCLQSLSIFYNSSYDLYDKALCIARLEQ